MKAALLAAALASPAVVSGMTRVQVPAERVQSDRQLEVSHRALAAGHVPRRCGSPRLASIQRSLQGTGAEEKLGVGEDGDGRSIRTLLDGRSGESGSPPRPDSVASATVIFEECLGVHLDTCKELIEAEVAANPAIFEGREALNFEIKHVRSGTDTNTYNLVGLRLDPHENFVAGIHGDGLVYYPYQWCFAEDDCFDIGPWDCSDMHFGEHMTVEQCCNLVKAHVPLPDMNGNYLECYTDLPVGSESNPIDYSRVLIHVDSNQIVVHPPMNDLVDGLLPLERRRGISLLGRVLPAECPLGRSVASFDLKQPLSDAPSVVDLSTPMYSRPDVLATQTESHERSVFTESCVTFARRRLRHKPNIAKSGRSWQR
ncbi:hypothetical protein THAOC_02271 [Thalassiosira oceanica]|uniref:Peptidase M14 carboxypeptidase A domain-containing protein n=1 Tax=Thalassiosira oceanica TaxID=159749 RepID=K0TB34_THAOC|nr:hypothetical protein THAOC_02271 [Thalassiosira oceanica]|eukprot:EJK75988.1 hypothetical protein THAOC_02271 [Thalassiosira oceanica]